MITKENLKGIDPIKYSRVSTAGQTETLPTQTSSINKALKMLGVTKKGLVYEEQGSGTRFDRQTLQEAILKAVEMKKKGKNPAIIVRDIQRFSRDPDDIGYLRKFFPSHKDSLWFNDIPIIALNDNIIMSTKSSPRPNDSLIAPILVAVGGSEVNIRKEQSLQGKKRAEEEGIVAGQPQNLYYKEKVNPYRAFYEMFFKTGLKQGAAAIALGRSRSWGKDTKNKMNRIILEGEKAGKKDLILEWLDVTDLIREFEQENGPRIGGSKRMNSVSRKTSGYLKFPEKFDAPTRENLQFYYDNFKLFQPKRKGV